ncbi:MAG: phosphoribosylamine--glycine ligase [Clostridiales bacterium]|jgi:phosphoribosylamine--glycine ligase|nr:phosphoribosylamine--glycine ligase [Clostridiales bacterium]
MKVLIVGGGGREHAIAQKLSQSPAVSEILCAPGNGGISEIAQCFDIKATNIDGLCQLAVDTDADFVVVAPDDPLALGLVDRLAALGIPAFGPNADAAEIESSKSFAKKLMKKYGIPTADFAVFDSLDLAIDYVNEKGTPLVIKCDGLAQGKGVIICNTVHEAEAAIKSMMSDEVFGKSGSTVVIEEYMTGPEVTVLCFADGEYLVPMPSSQDHKRAYDFDQGPNTGGMGAISPSPFYTEDVEAYCHEKIFLPTLQAMKMEGRPFKGVLYFGLMLTPDGPKVVEYNARFGDPETQVILPRLRGDLFSIMQACVNGTLRDIEIDWSTDASCCLVLASGGYPGQYTTGYKITGLNEAAGTVFHAGTKKTAEGEFVTAGGRVLGITALGDSLAEAVKNAYEAAKPIYFKDMHFRKDIGKLRETSEDMI